MKKIEKTIVIDRNRYGAYTIYCRIDCDGQTGRTDSTTYYDYTLREAIKAFRGEYGLKNKHCDVITLY